MASHERFLRAVLFALAFLTIGYVAAHALTSEAQTTAGISSRESSIAGGPGGMWVVISNRVYICQAGVQTGATPPAAVCGPGLALP